MTDQEIRLLCGELTASEMRLARALCEYFERLMRQNDNNKISKKGLLDGNTVA